MVARFHASQITPVALERIIPAFNGRQGNAGLREPAIELENAENQRSRGFGPTHSGR